MKRSQKNTCWAWHPSSVFHIFPYFNKQEMEVLHFYMAKKPALKFHTFLSYHEKYSTVQPSTTNAYFKAFKIHILSLFSTKNPFPLGVYSFLHLVAWTIMKKRWLKKPKTNRQKITLQILLLKLSRMGKPSLWCEMWKPTGIFLALFHLGNQVFNYFYVIEI